MTITGNLSWTQLIYYVVAMVAFVTLVWFGKVDITVALTAISFLLGHGVGAAQNPTVQVAGGNNGGNNTATSQTVSTP